MTLLLATLLLAQSSSHQPLLYQGDDPISVFVRPRGGVWASNSFEFQAIRTDLIQVDTNEKVLYSGGLDGGVRIENNFVIFASGEFSGTDDIQSELVGAYVGYRDYAGPNAPPGVPHQATAYVGAVWGTFDVQEEDFGEFDSGFGFAAGVELGWEMNRSFTLQLIGEYRLIKFDYKPDVLVGDTEAGGSTGWAGVGIEYRF